MLQKDGTTWTAKTALAEDHIRMHVAIPCGESYEDDDYSNWMDEILDMLLATGIRVISTDHIGSEATIDSVYDPE